jgi:hypothetical protein
VPISAKTGNILISKLIEMQAIGTCGEVSFRKMISNPNEISLTDFAREGN